MGGQEAGPAHENWARIQADIDSCQDCPRLGGDLLATPRRQPSRPPRITERPVLFVSEAPPPDGGFWAPRPVEDDLRENLFGILRELGVSLLLDDHAVETLNDFLQKGFFLVQALKWPLRESARTLRRGERDLIEHTVESHLRRELEALRPRAIVRLGKVACYALALCFPDSAFTFEPSARLESVRGQRFSVTLAAGDQADIYATALPVRRNMRERPRILEEIRLVIRDHWDAASRHIM